MNVSGEETPGRGEQGSAREPAARKRVAAAAAPAGRSALWRAGAVLLLVVLVAAASLGGLVSLGEGTFSVKGIEDTVASWGPWGVAASIALMVVHSFVPFPAEFLALANGMLYGPYWGTAITWVGAMLGAYLAFGLSRLLGRPFVETMVPRKRLSRLDDWTARQGAGALFLSRFLPVISFNLINYAAGLTNISWFTFTWTTGLGILPMILFMVVMGDLIEHMPWQTSLALFAAGAALWWLVFRKLGPMLSGRAGVERR